MPIVIVQRTPTPPVPPTPGLCDDIGSFGKRLWAHIKPLTAWDNNCHLWTYCGALGEIFQPFEDYSRGLEGWGKMLNVDENPIDVQALKWLAQFVGVTDIPSDLSPENMRLWVKGTVAWKRGSRLSMAAAAQCYLDPASPRTVIFLERDTSPYHLTVHTRAEETLYPVRVRDVLKAKKPGGLIMDYSPYPYGGLLTFAPNESAITITDTYPELAP